MATQYNNCYNGFDLMCPVSSHLPCRNSSLAKLVIVCS